MSSALLIVILVGLGLLVVAGAVLLFRAAQRKGEDPLGSGLELDLDEDQYAEAGVIEEEKSVEDLEARKPISGPEPQEPKAAKRRMRGVPPPAPAPKPQPKMRERAEDSAPEEGVGAELEEAAPEPAPPAPAAPAPASADIDGDVHGDVMVAGGDVIVVKNQAEALKYEKQARRFDAAFPDKVEHRKTATLWVGVTTPDAPPPFEGVPADAVTPGPTADIPLPVDPVSGDLQEVHLDVQIRAPQFEPSKDSATLTIRPDGSPDKVRFLLEAQDEGEGVILVQFYLDKKRLGEVELTSVVEKARVGEKFAFKLQVATLYLAFGVS
jgi:hypothetical protein